MSTGNQDDITRKQFINRETGIAISLCVVILSAAVSFTWGASKVYHRLGTIESGVAAVNQNLTNARSEWANRLADQNPELWVPDPLDPNLRRIKPNPD